MGQPVIEALLQAEQLLVLGMLDQAEELYRKSADADPQNAIAVVGLARVAIERGDERAAYGFACDALRIDPDDWLALRIEARLSEVLATRGEPVERPAWITERSPEAGRGALRRPDGAAEPSPDGAPQPSPAAASLAAAPSAGPSSPTEPDDLGMNAQRTAFTRNPSMADHRQRMEERVTAGTPPTAQPSSAEPPPAPPVPRWRRLLRRIRGR